MVDKGVKELCPTCGQPMNSVKSENQQTKMGLKDKDRDVKPFDISQIWHCINCSEGWGIDIIRNIWRKSEITK